MEEYLWLARKWRNNKAMCRIIFLNAHGRKKGSLPKTEKIDI